MRMAIFDVFMVFVWFGTPETRATKNRRSQSGSGGEGAERFSVQRIFPRCTSKSTRPSATVGFLRPRLAALVTQCVPDVGTSTAEPQKRGNEFLCHKFGSRIGRTNLIPPKLAMRRDPSLFSGNLGGRNSFPRTKIQFSCMANKKILKTTGREP